MATNVQFVLDDKETQRFRHAYELCANADGLDFAVLMFVVGEFETLIEYCGIVGEGKDADEDEDAVLV